MREITPAGIPLAQVGSTLAADGEPPLYRLDETMALREFVDAHGVLWQVWEVLPMTADRRRGRERRSRPRRTRERRLRHDAAAVHALHRSAGWLTFESKHEKRRLRPIPEGWPSQSDEDLQQLLDDAEPAPRTNRLIE